MVELRLQEPGQRLRRAREALRLKYRDVYEASQRIARQHGSHDFVVGLSRLADIENRGTVPSFYRLYSLCAIYRIEFRNAIKWYGIDLDELPGDCARVALDQTHLLPAQPPDAIEVDLPTDFDQSVDLRKTFYLSRHVHRWGRFPLALIGSLDVQGQRYGFIGTDDWSMYPILAPGSFVQIDEARRKIEKGGWTHEYERPIYFLEHRQGYRCGWCVEHGGDLILQPHSASSVPAEIFRAGEADVIGQVVAVAMRLDLGRRRHTRF